MKEDWIDVNIPFGPVYGQNEQLDSLVKRGLDRPGVLIKLSTGEKILIGDINPNRGSCDCCTVIDNRDIIVSYKIIEGI